MFHLTTKDVSKSFNFRQFLLQLSMMSMIKCPFGGIWGQAQGAVMAAYIDLEFMTFFVSNLKTKSLMKNLPDDDSKPKALSYQEWVHSAPIWKHQLESSSRQRHFDRTFIHLWKHLNPQEQKQWKALSALKPWEFWLSACYQHLTNIQTKGSFICLLI